MLYAKERLVESVGAEPGVKPLRDLAGEYLTRAGTGMWKTSEVSAYEV